MSHCAKRYERKLRNGAASAIGDSGLSCGGRAGLTTTNGCFASIERKAYK